MENIWEGFTASEEMVHELDRPSVLEHNARVRPEHKFLLHLSPEPWIGNLEGNLFVLYSNPGATQGDLAKIEQKDNALIVEKSIKNLNQMNDKYPHFFFDPELVNTDGGKWFRRRYRWLIDATDLERVANNVVTCELAPYHSIKWRNPKTMPPTQEFTYQAIRNAFARDATILIGRTPKVWKHHIPELEKYPRVFRPNGINASVSPGNYPKNFDRIVDALGSSA